QDRDLATAVADQLAPLQRPRRIGDADTPNPQHECEELVGHGECIGVGPVARHQQPSGESRLNDMKSVAGDRLGELAHDYEEVSMQLTLQGRTALELAKERRHPHAQCLPGSLDQGAQAEYMNAEN